MGWYHRYPGCAAVGLWRSRVWISEAEYERALTKIERLTDSQQGTSAFGELELVSALVEGYEEA